MAVSVVAVLAQDSTLERNGAHTSDELQETLEGIERPQEKGAHPWSPGTARLVWAAGGNKLRMAAATVGASPGAHAQSDCTSFSGSSQFFRCSISFSPAHAMPEGSVKICLHAAPNYRRTPRGS